MKTNLEENQNAVLYATQGDIVGVIQIDAGKNNNIEPQLINAINVFEDAHTVKIDKVVGDLESFDVVEIYTSIIDNDDKKYKKIFNIELAGTF